MTLQKPQLNALEIRLIPSVWWSPRSLFTGSAFDIQSVLNPQKSPPLLLAVGKLIFPSVPILSFWVPGGHLHFTGSLVCTVPPLACSWPEEVCGVVVFCIVSFCKHCSSRLPIPGCVQADFIVCLGHSLEIRETRRARGSCVTGMHSLWSAFNPFRSCCVQAGGLSFSVLPFQEDNLKSSLISLCLITKIPEAGGKGQNYQFSPPSPEVFFSW